MPADNTATKLPQDRDSNPIQVLAADFAGKAEVAIGAGNTRTTLPSGAEIVEVSVSVACRFAIGDSSVDATSGHILNPGTYVYRVKNPVSPNAAAPTHFAAIQLTTGGICTVVRLF